MFPFLVFQPSHPPIFPFGVFLFLFFFSSFCPPDFSSLFLLPFENTQSCLSPSTFQGLFPFDRNPSVPSLNKRPVDFFLCSASLLFSDYPTFTFLPPHDLFPAGSAPFLSGETQLVGPETPKQVLAPPPITISVFFSFFPLFFPPPV